MASPGLPSRTDPHLGTHSRMSEKESKPFHAKDVSSGQETADVLAEVLQHAKEKDQAAKGTKVEKKGQPKWVPVIGANLGPSTSKNWSISM